MRRICYFFILTLFLSTAAWSDLHAQLNYGFLVGTGTRMTGAFTILQNGSRAGAGQTAGIYQPTQNLISIGFTFNFNGTNYTTLSVCSNGFMTLGGTYGSPTNNGLRNVGATIIAPFWDQLRVTGGGNSCGLIGRVQYFVSGTAPNRILVVDYQNVSLGDGWAVYAYSPVIFQARLYETSNKIEFFYQSMPTNRPACETRGGTTTATTGSIGITSAAGFISVTPNGNTATASALNDNASVDLRSSTITSGTLYTFCTAGIVGNAAQGGTTTMANGDSLLRGRQVVMSSSQNFTPFTLNSPCASTFTYTIAGPRASEYSINPSSGAIPPTGSTPVLTFSPAGLGRRDATLQVRDNLGFVVRTFNLAGEGIPRVIWIGNIADGGTTGLVSGDTLMRNVAVDNGSSRGFTPITVQVNGTSGPPAPMTYTLVDPTGQFSLNKTSEAVLPGGASTLVVTFTPTGIGPQEATLTVNAEGDVRTFLLRPFARGAGARFYIGSEPLTAGSAVFQNAYTCVGSGLHTIEMTIESIGDLPFNLETSEVYQTENTIRQGVPPYPLLRDDMGNFILLQDYFVSEAAGSRTPLQLPVVVQPGARKTIYLTFVPTREGKRRARAFFRTNGLNFFGLTTDNVSARGLLNFELVGDGLSSGLVNKDGSDLPDALVFPATEVRSSSMMTGYIHNNGECDLLVSGDDFRLVTGDIAEFKIESGLRSAKDAMGNHILPPGAIDSFTVSFTPVRSGSRRASIYIESNDSSVIIPGVSSRGTYHLDVFGTGKVGLEARPVIMPPAAIGGPSTSGKAILENTSAETVTVIGISIVDPNGEIVEDPSNRWPGVPVVVPPSGQLDLGLLFTPAVGSSPGMRNVIIEITLSNGDIVKIDVRALAGFRELSVAPTNLFQGLTLDVGDIRRQFVSVTNTGTFPLKVQELRLTETNPGDYKVSSLVRSILEPGQIEFIEVTYSPQASGASSGTLEIVSNATNGPHVVNLGGTATGIAPIGGGMGSSIAVAGDISFAVRPNAGMNGWGASMKNGTLLWPSSPNPAKDQAEIKYYLPQSMTIELTLYTSDGKEVREIVTGEVNAGEHNVSIDVSNLASGNYYYVLRSGSEQVTLPLTVLR